MIQRNPFSCCIFYVVFPFDLPRPVPYVLYICTRHIAYIYLCKKTLPALLVELASFRFGLLISSRKRNGERNSLLSFFSSSASFFLPSFFLSFHQCVFSTFLFSRQAVMTVWMLKPRLLTENTQRRLEGNFPFKHRARSFFNPCMVI